MKVSIQAIRTAVPVLLFLILSAGSDTLKAGQVNVALAVDSLFDFTLDELKRSFEETTGDTVNIVPGPGADLYARIIDGAGFDLFLSGDVSRPEVLESQGRAIAGSRFTYARSRLVLWSVTNRPLGPAVLQDGEFQLLAVANPLLDPYGRAAKQFLEALELWDGLQEKIVMGENIGQTYQFAISGDVDMAIIAFSQIIYGDYMQAGRYWVIPESYYSPLDQQAVLLTDNPTAASFVQFMQSSQGRNIIISNGFEIPDAD